jgi:hypothetical protein
VPHELCQIEEMKAASEHSPKLRVLLHQFRYFWRQEGALPTIGRAANLFAGSVLKLFGIRKSTKPIDRNDFVSDALGLRPGELVEVKTAEEIRKGLDARGKHRGLHFSEEMEEYCGRQFRVFKRIEKICMEGKEGEIRTLKDTVSLEGVICNGGSRGCDRACFLFWREAWLKRVNGPGLQP